MFIRRHEEQSYPHNLLPEGADKPAVWGFERISEAFVQREESMLQLIRRCPEYAAGYKDYCRELYDHNVVFFRPSDPKYLEGDWFERTKDWYDRKEKGLVEGRPVSFHYWAVDGGRFIGEFQLRTEFPPKVMLDIGSIGYAVRVSESEKTIGEVCLLTNDVLRLAAFYKQLLCVENGSDDETHQFIITEGTTLTIYNDGTVKNNLNQNICLAFTVDDIDREYEKVAALGAEITEPPTKRPWGTINMRFYDPDHNRVFFRSYPRE